MPGPRDPHTGLRPPGPIALPIAAAVLSGLSWTAFFWFLAH